MSKAAPYAALSPDTALDAIAACGLHPDGRLLALNSYENRVYQIGLDGGTFIVAKFYRPQRWSDVAIGEEHAFARELSSAELPMVAPLAFEGETLLRHGGFRYAVYPRRGGRAPELETREHLEWVGRLIARMHGIGARDTFSHRGAIDRDTFIDAPARAVLASPLLPARQQEKYRQAIARAGSAIAMRFDSIGAVTRIRLHGDCHPGNLLWTDAGPHFVDLDDARTGPAVQDLWMLANDDAALDALLEGYAQFRDFDPRERALIPALRAMRQVHWAGWIAARWDDPAFPLAFPFAAEPRWWEQHVADLHEAAEALE
ncbi:MAG TPA: serine/threonine protein kinase [Rhodanobacteraceae bacterium]|nr:serine/threonine protein kinase [Rhodanobacteraceae bacterium]